MAASRKKIASLVRDYDGKAGATPKVRTSVTKGAGTPHEKVLGRVEAMGALIVARMEEIGGEITRDELGRFVREHGYSESALLAVKKSRNIGHRREGRRVVWMLPKPKRTRR